MPFDGTARDDSKSVATSLLEEAAKILERPERWTKGHLRQGGVFRQPRYCASGAILQAAANRGLYEWTSRTVPPEAQWAVSFLTSVVRAQNAYPAVESMNDHPDTTHADVLHAFGEAIWLSRFHPRITEERVGSVFFTLTV